VYEWLETTALAVWVNESPSIWALPTVLTLHTTGMGVLVGVCMVLDMRLLGLGRNVPIAAFGWIFRVVAIALAVNLTTGVLLFIRVASTWGHSFAFLVKMLLVVAAAATILPLRSIVRQSGAADLDASSRARVLAVVSIVTWCGAVTAGRLLAYLMV
jgi:hypothetical protein